MEETIIVMGWKGKGELQINEGTDYYRIIEFRKSKETGEVYESIYKVDKKIVQKVWEMIRINCELNIEYKYRFLIKKWIEQNKINERYGYTVEQMIESFNGGRFRKLEYFPFYYSLKVLEAKGLIQYFGKGGIVRLSDDYNL